MLKKFLTALERITAFLRGHAELVVFAIAWIILWFIGPGWFNAAIMDKASGQALTVFSIFFGFVFASFALLLGISDKPMAKDAWLNGYFHEIVRMHLHTMVWIVFTIVSALLFPYIATELALRVCGAILISCTLATAISMLRILRLMRILLLYSIWI